MKFIEHTENSLIEKIKEKRKDLFAEKIWGNYFILFYPANKADMQLKKNYKPVNEAPGIFTEYNATLKNQTSIIHYLEEKLVRNNFTGNDYYNDDAALKLHINLNDIAQMDESVILGLIELLIQESESEDNDLQFKFKIIDPTTFTDLKSQKIIERFLNTDQLTIYFDKYSSTGDMIRLTQKIEQYLLSCDVPKNKIALGPKDSLGFNSFVSARFDNNRLIRRYDLHRFFDIELTKFFDNQAIDLSNIPLCAFEAVFNTILLSDKITNIDNNNMNGLTEEESKLVQSEFNKMLADPQNYMLAAQKISAPILIKQQEQVTHLTKAATDFKRLLGQLEKKHAQLIKENASERAQLIENLYKKLNNELKIFQKGQNSLADFKIECNHAIQEVRPHLEIHRGWKELFSNLLAGIATLGIIYAVNYFNSKGNSLFFKVNTDSINKLNELTHAIADIKAPSQPAPSFGTF